MCAEACQFEKFDTDAMLILPTYQSAQRQLPFALCFQLEHCLFHQNTIPTHIPRMPQGKRQEEQEMQKKEVSLKGQRLLYELVSCVIPVLTKINDSLANQTNTTLHEFCADGIWTSLCCVKDAVRRNMQVMFSEDNVQKALAVARARLKNAEKVCQRTEAELTSSSSCEQYILIWFRSVPFGQRLNTDVNSTLMES